jgi:pimeloyl-ACP methyl ester carboxylesterase
MNPMGLKTEIMATDQGKISYYYYEKEGTHHTILFIHGLGEDKEWFSKLLEKFSLDRYTWIVPDLIGHGASERVDDLASYTMQSQAKAIHAILKGKGVKRVAILAHSMGGPIAVSLIEQLKDDNDIAPTHLFYLEGNIDSGDAFFSSKVASMTLKEYTSGFDEWYEQVTRETEEGLLLDWYKGIGNTGPVSVWASSTDLVSVSNSGEIMDRLKTAITFPVYFFFGEKNKGVYSSEKTLRDAGYQVLYVPLAGHSMYLENPEWFWEKIHELLSL